MKIKDYIVLHESSVIDLVYEVEKKIKAGWQPLGGIAVTTSMGNYVTHYQTMVKYEQRLDFL